MTTNIIRSSKQNPCPVCDRTKDSDCSQYYDGLTVMCKTYVDGSGHDESKWHYTGVNELGFQGKFILKTEPEFKKTPRLIGTKYYEYPSRDGKPLARVGRTDYAEEDKDKDIWQESIGKSGKWVRQFPKEVRKDIAIYRYPEVRGAIERNEQIFIVEGETTADASWQLGIPATTTIGGSGGYTNYGIDYSEDLKGARLILAPDRDANGLKYIANFERKFPTQIEGYYLAGTEKLWCNPSGGMDIGDDIADHGYTKEQILDRIITPEKYRELTAKPEPSSANDNPKPSHFKSTIETGLVKVTADGDKESNELIGNHLAAIAVVDNPEQDGAALLLEFKTFRGDIRRWTMLRAYLAGDGSAIAEGLLSRGYNFKRKQKGALLDYIQSLGSDVEKTYTVTDFSGWVNRSFVLPHKTHGDEDLKFRDVDPSPEALTEIKGSLQGWIDNVAARCAGNSRSILAIGSSFAAPLLPIADVESGGFHLVGATSQGKTTILSVAASVTGLKTVSSWRTTDNALEGGLAASNHLCLPLDELNQADPRKVGAIVYMLGNGIGKGRAQKDGTNRKFKVWLTLVLSSGETTIGKFMELAGESIKGGQEVRLPNIPAVPDGSLYGCFETIHGADTAVQFVSALEAAAKQHHGVALDAFLSRLVVDAAVGEASRKENPAFSGNISKQVTLIAAKLSEGTKDSAIGRVAKRFALVQVALGLAHKYDLLPFPVEQIEWAISTCFTAWLKARGGDGSIEIKNALKRIEHLLVTNELGDRVFTLPNNDGLKPRNLLAYRKLDFEGQTEELWVPKTVFDEEFCDGVNKSELVKELQRLGWLLPPRPDGKAMLQRRVNIKRDYYYVFGKRENSGESGESGESEHQTIDTASVSHTLSLTHQPVLPSESGESLVGCPDALTHPTHLQNLSSESVGATHNHYVMQVMGGDSPDSPDSLPKTEIGNLDKFKIGDRVKYMGEDAALFDLSQGEMVFVTEDVEDGSQWVRVRTANKKPLEIPLSDLQLVEAIS